MRRISLLVAALVLSGPVRAVAQGDSPGRTRIMAAAREVMTTARYATFVTVGEDGRPQARIVDPFPPDSDLVVWVATNPLTRKVGEIRRDPRVTLLYFNAAASEYVTIHAWATLVSDSASKARHWKPEWAGFYPGGPQGEGYLLIRLRPTQLEIASPRHGLVNDPRTWRPVVLDLP